MKNEHRKMRSVGDLRKLRLKQDRHSSAFGLIATVPCKQSEASFTLRTEQARTLRPAWIACQASLCVVKSFKKLNVVGNDAKEWTAQKELLRGPVQAPPISPATRFTGVTDAAGHHAGRRKIERSARIA